MKHVVWGAFWIVVYLALVLAPLFVLLVGPTPPGVGFWWDFSLALGFAGTAMLGVQFVLTARFRRATAPYGIDIIYYFHRYAALVAVALIVSHPIILIAINPGFLHLLNPFDAPAHMVAGTGSVVAMLLLIVSSVWRKPLQIHYDAWRLWHALLAVAAVLLALVHIEGVGYYIATPWKRGLWTLILASGAILLLYVRVVKPWRLTRAPYRVVDVREERGNAWTVALEPDRHPGFRFEPGQFAWVTLRHSPFVLEEHPFSISSSPAILPRLEFTIKELGDFTRTIGQLQRGETAYVDGPYGAFSIDRYPEAPGFVFISGGIGIAPMISMVRAMADRGDRRPVLLICANSRWERVSLREAIHALTPRADLRIVHVLEEPPEGWDGERGYVTRAVLERHLPPERRTLQYFVCGPPAMIAAIEAALYQMGIGMNQSHTELFDLV
jgi:predicted ferric reductase